MIPESEVIGNQVAQELQNLHRRLEAAKGFARALLLHVSVKADAAVFSVDTRMTCAGAAHQRRHAC
jgi:hypothetical protein